MNMANVALMVKQVRETVRESGVDLALIEILKTVRHWPAQLEETGLPVSTSAFNATEISTKKIEQDSDTITSVSFTYSGEKYDFDYKPNKSPIDCAPGDNPFATISLHENGERVIVMSIVQDPSQDLYGFHDIRSIKFGPWIDIMLRIKEEIELQSERKA